MSKYLGVTVMTEGSRVKLYFDQDIRDACFEGEDEMAYLSSSIYYGLQELTIVPDAEISSDRFSATFTLRYGVSLERAIGEVLAVICKHHPKFYCAIVRM